MILDTWETPDQMYLARADEVSPYRPIFTGDVFDGVTIPGVEADGAAIVIAHPCAMRGKHASLRDRILVASVRAHQEVPPRKWASGHLDRMPLPELRGPGAHFEAAWLADIGRAETDHLQKAERLACLSPIGVNMLQQRMICHLTRYDLPTAKLWEAFGHTYEEAELREEWTENHAEVGCLPEAAAASFEAWIRDSGRQDRLRDPQQRASVRSEMRRELQKRTQATS